MLAPKRNESMEDTKDFDDPNSKINLDDKGQHKWGGAAAPAIHWTAANEIFSDYGRPQGASVPKRASCTCAKTQCLKLYCACFKDGVPCGIDCKCTGCVNTAENAEEVKLFREKKQLREQTGSEAIFCNCRMSFCEKSYCACGKSGLGCSELCKCFNCKNPKGAKGRHQH